ncbi:molybdopterin molybdotransferase MoeA [Natroniella sulfidigena]|uniref:molybdopterin molybdotransferase MoeA n=1 Tax=Natroniella sulfidigena TaxID=723921 RepID=UPI00200B8945|nr:gephyrin-like molybdotransferase Glp [Natroniella sulfidigena]MCK8816089.1 molybdopterin molybdotransferase MoeA [Natroniella sulfidigena]
MSNLFNLIDPKEVDQIFTNKLEQELTTEQIDLTEATGRVLARDINSPIDLPPFTRSTMDGYAVKAEDTFGASETKTVYLDLVGEVLMGEEATQRLESGQAIKISTGGMLPEGADAVLMVEYTEQLGGDLVEISRAVASGENVVQQGEDIACDEILLTAGSQLRAQDIGALAGLGITEVEVFSQPKVTVFATGNELVPPSQTPQQGEIRDINSYSIASFSQDLAVVNYGGIIRDEKQELKDKLKEALAESDLIILSGGSSVGTKDLTLEVVDELGEPGVLVHGISIKPGKPTVLALVDGTPIIGLPGHPTSAMTVFKIVVKPLVKLLAGLKDKIDKEDNYLTAKLSRNVASDKGREEYIRVKLEEQDGFLEAIPVLGKSSLVTTMVEADGLVKIDLGTEGLEQGAEVQVLMF